jgi:chromate reductase, NAD(P)H dehydrogenase (quinone)
MKILAFGASNSQNSINQQFAVYTAKQFEDSSIEILNLNHFDLPLYSVDREKEMGHPKLAHQFIQKIDSSDLIIISLAEHNGSYTAAFKNLFDWVSRVKLKMFAGKKLFLLATAPGPRGGLTTLEVAKHRFPSHGAEIITDFCLPKFAENFDSNIGIKDEVLKASYLEKIEMVKKQMAEALQIKGE